MSWPTSPGAKLTKYLEGNGRGNQEYQTEMIDSEISALHSPSRKKKAGSLDSPSDQMGYRPSLSNLESLSEARLF